MKATITEIFETATEINAAWDNISVIKFHAYNPNGLRAYLRDLEAKVLEAVEAGKAKSGALLVYGGSSSECYIEQLFELAKMQRVNSCKKLAILRCLEDHITAVEKFLEGL